MATFFRNSTVPGVGQTQSLILETDASQLATVIGLSLTNKTANLVTASIVVRNNLSVDTYFVKDIVIAPDSTLRAVTQGEKLILENSNQLSVLSSQDNSIDVVASFVLIV
jgi:UTP:GlnB (protein PII) uridylyltransferase